MDISGRIFCPRGGFIKITSTNNQQHDEMMHLFLCGSEREMASFIVETKRSPIKSRIGT
jgi:hypothetical protein